MGKLTNYNKEKTIFNGTTTIVYGSTIAKLGDIADAEVDLMNKMEELLTSSHYCNRGIARLSGADTYDQKLGELIATKKAEAAGCAEYARDLKKGIALAEKFIAEANKAVDKLENHVAAVSEHIKKL